MDVQAPSAQTTLLILLGASAWPRSPEFQSSEAFANAARRVKAYFLNPRPFGLPAENLLDLFDSDKSTDELDVTIGQFLEQRIAALKKMSNPARDLLLYFIGHGGFAGRDSNFYLAIRRTRTQSPRASSIDMISLAETLTESARHMRRIIILDCCFAAAAYAAFQAGPDQVALEKTVDAFKVNQKAVGFPTKGTTLLCSSSQKSPSLLLPDGSSTMFSKALLDTLVQGTAVQRDRLSLRDVKDGTADYLSEIRNAPRPVVLSPDQSEGDVADMPFFPNSWIEEQRLQRIEEERRRQAEEIRQEEEERRRNAEEERVRQVEAERRRQVEMEERKLQVEEEGRQRRGEVPVPPVETPSDQVSSRPGAQAAMIQNVPIGMALVIDDRTELIGGETKEISVIAADFRGFTSLSERKSSKEAMNLLNTYLEILVKEIRDEGGTVTGIWGDTLMAIFNAPLPQQDHVLRAVRAAWKMRLAILEYQRTQPKDSRYAFGIGVNTGEAMVGNIDSRDRIQNYTAIGDVVNVAVRLKAVAQDNNILLNDSTFSRIRQQVRVSKLPPLTVKSKAKPLDVWLLIGLDLK